MGDPALGVWPEVLSSPQLKGKVQQARVLCVGAGGIGCELLKTLVCTGFRCIEVIDLDTIETSNLNRQFLFRRHHVGQSKARTAADVIRGFRPEATITSHHANVKELQFGVEYIKGFDLILNGLDNLEARRHVNRLAMAAHVPLVESGSAGYLGQVTVHLKGESECFECAPKPVPKTFPICTLRNTPDKPIHCIVWAKDLLFGRMFGKPELTDLDEAAKQVAAESETVDVNAVMAVEVAEEASAFVLRSDEGLLEYALRIFTRVFTTDIERLMGMEELWKSRAAPHPLQLEDLFPSAEGGVRPWLALDSAGLPQASGTASRALGLTDANQDWSARDNARVFLRSIVQYHTQRVGQLGSAVFDKDDDLAVDFVTSASNLRSLCYGIPTQALFVAKGMAGNIIHAIATTNAIISGLIVAEALKILAGCRPACRATYLYEVPSGKRLLNPSTCDKPRDSCMVCSRAVLTLRVDTAIMTLGQLLGSVCKQRLAMVTPMLVSGDFLYEEGEGLEEDEVASYTRMLALPLAKLPGQGLQDGCMLHVSDETQAFEVDLSIVHQDKFDTEKAPEGWVLEGAVPAALEQPVLAPGLAPATGPSPGLEDDDGDLEIIEPLPVATPGLTQAQASGKRPADNQVDADASKRAKLGL